MKKLLVSLLTLITCTSVDALPVGNPSEASLLIKGAWWEGEHYDVCDPCFCWYDAWSVRLGFAGDYVYNRHMHVKARKVGKEIETTQINTNAAYLVLNFCDRFDIFGTVGESKIHIRTNAVSWGATTSLESELGFDSFLAWSAGARCTVWECAGFSLGIEGEYFQTVPEVNYFLNYNDGSLIYFGEKAHAFYSEWQVGGGVSYRFATPCPTLALVPYAALKWANAKLQFHDFRFPIASPFAETLELYPLKSKKIWGYAIGISFTLCDMIGVTVEGSFADEKALYVNGQARF